MTAPARVILLSGPSIGELNRLGRFEIAKERATFYAINRKTAVEKLSLEVFGRAVQHWCMFSAVEYAAQASCIDAFLADPATVRLITYSKALRGSSAHRLSDKIALADDVVTSIYDRHEKQTGYRPKDGMFNSLFVLLHFLAQEDAASPIYLLGCDGMPRRYQEADVYFAQDEFYEPKRLRQQAIRRDMLTFRKHWKASVRDVDVPRIVNVNPASYYHIFEKISCEAFVQEVLVD